MKQVGSIRGRAVEAHAPIPCPACGRLLGRLLRTATDVGSSYTLCFYCEAPLRFEGETRLVRVLLEQESAEVQAEFQRFVAVLREAKARCP